MNRCEASCKSQYSKTMPVQIVEQARDLIPENANSFQPEKLIRFARIAQLEFVDQENASRENLPGAARGRRGDHLRTTDR